MASTNNRVSSVQTTYIDALTLATMNASSLQYAGQLGQFVEKNGKTYQLVLVDSTSSVVAANTVLTWLDMDDFSVTSDVSESLPNLPAGVAIGTITAGSYGFIQVHGPATAATDGGDDISAGDVLFVDPTTDGTVDSTAAATAPIYLPIGVATAADVDTLDTVAMFINVPLNR
jgi:hypothetical protein